MRIGLYHGYELIGSGSNEYTRYLAASLLELGHEVHIICREQHPGQVPFVERAIAWDRSGSAETIFSSSDQPRCILHQLPYGDVRPVYITDKQRQGNVKAFVSLSDDEIASYHAMNELILQRILSEVALDVLHANHLIYQPIDALDVCRKTGTPLVIYPHGSSIEYVVKADRRFYDSALHAILECAGLIIGNREVRDRIVNLYPEYCSTILEKTQIVGVGVDTSLFRPVARSQRRRTIEKLIATGGRGGKRQAQSAELERRLDKLDIEAVREYWDAYDHSLPDEELNETLSRIPWEEHILLFVGAFTAGKGLQSLIIALPFILMELPDTHMIIVGAGAYREVLEALVHALSSGNLKLLHTLAKRGMDLDRSELTGAWDDVLQFLDKPGTEEFLLEYGKLLIDHIHFLGRLNHDRLQYLFPCADLAVFPSVVPEAYPLVLMESLSNGVIPVVSYFSGFKDGVDELEPSIGTDLTEYMKIPLDPAIRVDRIITNIENLLRKSGEKSEILRSVAEREYDWLYRAAQMVSAYEHIVDSEEYQ